MKHFLVTLIFSAPLLAGEFNPNHVASDAKWWLHADLAAARNTEPGQRIVEEIEERHGDQLNALKLMFSVNPLTDLNGITLFGDGRKDKAVALIEGRFNREHLEGLVKVADNYDSHDHGSFLIHSWDDEGKRQNASFAKDDMLVFSHSKALLHDALDMIQSGKGMASDSFVTSNGASPFVVGSAMLSKVEMDGDEAHMLGKAEALKIALDEDNGRITARIMIETGKAKDGQRFRKVMEGMIALGELSDAPIDPEQMNFKVSTEQGGKILKSSMSLPSSMMIEWMEAEGAFDFECDEE